ncbi:MAG: DUF4920 domain-containing protein [Desulfobulbaceae bacterium]|uniref:DUF4920 domain-containing protein n=1 Tax=Candidatus Desulfobia pelagia TaxID=2841692 RepID=A0A8J6NBU6_9BACT|nr:DUF4920 domain-containing protein [Candidatus Desulfobia pelagia]
MKKLLPFTLLFLLICHPVLANDISLGEKLILDKKTLVSEINDEPEKYLGKRVRIEGIIIEVCAARGCWVEISSDVPFQKIQVKVVDGEIIFPMEAKGRTAAVEGLVEKLELSHAQSLAYARHKADEQGKEFDPSQVTGPTKIYRIRGLGAVIK